MQYVNGTAGNNRKPSRGPSSIGRNGTETVLETETITNSYEA